MNICSIIEYARKMNNTIIVGAGNRGQALLYGLKKENDIYVKAIFDNNPQLTGARIEDVKICKPYKITDGSTVYIIAIDSKQRREVLKNQLLELGIHKEVILEYYKYWTPEYRKEIKKQDIKDVLQEMYFEVFGKIMDWDNPRTYNEIINWEKINSSDSRRTTYADKYLVREYVKEKIGEDHLTKWYGVWDDANDIDFESLPDKFVLKTNNGSARNIIVTDKAELDIDAVRKQLNEWRDSDYSYMCMELHYKDIVPKIICEEYLEGVAESVYDYDIYCFHGEPEYIECIKGCHREGTEAAFYNKNWEKQNFRLAYPIDEVLAPKPEKLVEMLEYSRILSQDFKHVRVDWYNLPDGRVLFCEMTFATWGGLKKFEPEEYDVHFGRLILQEGVC